MSQENERVIDFLFSFLFFQNIELTVKDVFTTTVLPVASDPKDVIGSIGDVADKPFDNPFQEIPDRLNQATKDFDWSKILKIISLVLIILAILVFLPVLGPIFAALFSALKLPERFFSKRKRKNGNKKE